MWWAATKISRHDGSVVEEWRHHIRSANEPSDAAATSVPPEWGRHIDPRRGGGWRQVRAPRRDAGAVVRLLTPPPSIRRMLAPSQRNPRGPSLSTAAHAHLAGESTPAGAAVLAAATAFDLGESAGLACLADAWVETEGLVFAARAVAELNGFWARPWRAEWRQPLRLVLTGDGGAAFSPSCEPITRRVRALLAVAPAQVYADATTALTEYRSTLAGRVVSSFLVPTRQDWVAADCAEKGLSKKAVDALIRSVSTAAQLTTVLGAAVRGDSPLRRPEVLCTAADGMGSALTPFLRELLERSDLPAGRQPMSEMLAWFATEESIAALLPLLGDAPVPGLVRTALRRIPAAGLRLLAAASAKDSADPAGHLARRLLREHVADRPDLARTLVPQLPADHRAAVERVTKVTVSRRPIPLVEPPPRSARPWLPTPVPGLVSSVEPAMSWLPGEREDWAAEQRSANPAPWLRHDDWTAVAAAFSAGELTLEEQFRMFAEAPAEITGCLLAHWRPPLFLNHRRRLRPIVARHGLATLPLLFSAVRRRPERTAAALLPVVHPGVAASAARWLRRHPARWIGLNWLTRHPTAAADLLIVQAGGHPHPARRASAVDALRALVEVAGPQVVFDVAARHGDRADPITDSLSEEARAPRRRSEIHGWTAAEALPSVLLRDQASVLPDPVVDRLLRMLARSHSGRRDPGIAVLRARCDPTSLAEFGMALFWHSHRHGAGVPGTDWVLRAQAVLGDDETARQLGELVSRRDERAGLAIDALAELGSDAAVEQLRRIVDTTRSVVIRSRARDQLVALAARRGMTVDQALESITPDLGFAPGGVRPVEAAGRRVTVVVEQGLVPAVIDDRTEPAGQCDFGAEIGRSPAPASVDGAAGSSGRPVGRRVSPGGDDSTEHGGGASAARGAAEPPWLAALADRLAQVAEESAVLLERALRHGRTWSSAEFRRRWVEHPLLGRLAQGLVWTAQEPGRSAPAAFRIAEDGSFADVNDDTVTPAPSALIELPHPLRLGSDLHRWSALFADYEIIQPIPQLGRASYLTRPDDPTADPLPAAGGTVTEAALRRLLALSWRQGARDQQDRAATIFHPISAAHAVVVEVSPGFLAENGSSRYRLRDIRIAGPVDDPWRTVATTTIGEPADEAWSIARDDLLWLTEGATR
ncbi:DUF4132 domain-containing protein [Actinoalloteichus sp. GBA129-24]|uniref:DUF4132 domain-containing protein n=1 Tax=Actinoalloteichus sp. GBA129-24 TaxID=1612551 RepID=UPI000AE06FAD|nr:DUF4132 domain-containing protein [Actinoalloteichus sp. GBA129-24]